MLLPEKIANSLQFATRGRTCSAYESLQHLRTCNLASLRIEGALKIFRPCFCPAVTDGRGWLVAPPHHPKFEKCCKAQIKRKGLRRGGRKYFLLRASLASFPSWPRLYFPVSPDLRDLRVAIKDLKLVWLAGWLSWRRNDHRSHVLIHRLRLHSRDPPSPFTRPVLIYISYIFGQ